jgi:hypothetical protein
MNKVKAIISVIGVVVKYSAIVMAIIKGIEVAYSELQKIEWNDNELVKVESEPVKPLGNAKE